MGTGGEPSWWLGPPTLVAGLALGWYLAYRGGYVPSLLFASAPGTAPENHVRVSRPHPRIRVSRSGHPVHVVVLTGSSSSAKTTAIAAVSDRLSTLGFRVMASVTPQIPVPLSDRGLGTRERLVRSALDLEDNLIALALARDEPTVLLLDRGTPGVSTSAPSSFASVTSLVDDRSLDESDARYDAVVHIELANESSTQEDTSSGAWREHPARVIVASPDAAAAAAAAAVAAAAVDAKGAPLAVESSSTGANAHPDGDERDQVECTRTGTADRFFPDVVSDVPWTGVRVGGEAPAARDGGGGAGEEIFGWAEADAEELRAEVETPGETVETVRSARGTGARGAGMIGSHVHPKAKKPRRPGG